MPLVQIKPYEQLWSRYPLLRLLLPLMAGIAVARAAYGVLCGAGWVLVVLLLVSVVPVVVLLLRRPRPVRSGWLVAFNAAVAFTVALAGASLLVIQLDHLRVSWPANAQVWQATVVQPPRLSARSQLAVARIEGGRFGGRRVQVRLQHSDDGAVARVVPGDRLLLNAHIEYPHNLGNPGEFDYAAWLLHQGVVGTAFCPKGHWRVLGSSPHLPLEVRALRWRDKLTSHYAEHLEGDRLAVLSALTLGDKSMLDRDVRELFSHAGASHVLALSGLHLGILFFFYNVIVLRLCRSRSRHMFVVLSLLAVPLMWSFAFMAGLPPSLVRATLMYTLFQVARCVRRDGSAVGHLLLAAFVMLLLSPQSLYDVGFQLSCVSLLFILLFADSVPCPRILRPNEYQYDAPQRLPVRLLRWAYSLFAVSLCAQLGTAPLVAYYFHLFPTYALLSAFVVVPVAYGLLSGALLFFLFPVAREWIAWGLDALLTLMEQFLQCIRALSCSVLSVYPTLVSVAACYLLVLFVVLHRLEVRAAVRRGLLYAMCATVLVACALEVNEKRPGRVGAQLVAYNSPSAPALHCIASASESCLWMPDSLRAAGTLSAVRRTYWAREGISEPHRLEEGVPLRYAVCSDGLLRFGPLRVALVVKPLWGNVPSRPLQVDALLVCRGSRSSLQTLVRHYEPKKLVLDGSLTDFWRNVYREEAAVLGLEVYDVAERGAWVVPL